MSALVAVGLEAERFRVSRIVKDVAGARAMGEGGRGEIPGKLSERVRRLRLSACGPPMNGSRYSPSRVGIRVPPASPDRAHRQSGSREAPQEQPAWVPPSKQA